MLQKMLGLLIATVSTYTIVKKTNEYFIFKPITLSIAEYTEILNFYPNKIIVENYNGVDYILYNYYKKPSWNDTIILYSHGNYGNISNVLTSESLKILSKYGSILIYDYTGYGINPGTPTEDKMYNDGINAWNYIVNYKNIKSTNVILYGFSLGTAITTNILKNNVNPKITILESPFINIKELTRGNVPSFMKHIVIYNFNNEENIKTIIENNKNTKIKILHSLDDELVPAFHSLYLMEKYSCELTTISGTHNEPNYGDSLDKILMESILFN